MLKSCLWSNLDYLWQNKEMVWDAGRNFPPVRACLFSHNLSVVTFLGDLSAGGGLPRGTMVYANIPIPQQVRPATTLTLSYIPPL